MDKRQDRVIELQRQVMVAKTALNMIKNGCRDPEGVAEAAIDLMWVNDKKQPLQGLVGHGRNRG